MTPPLIVSRILIVDDDVGLARLIERTLQREGFATATANSGQEAFAWLTENTAALLLLDLKLPDIEGKELINQLESVDRRLPFVIITGQGDERIAVDMMKRGALDYLVKDVQFVEFVPTVVQRTLARIEQDRKLAAAEQALREAIGELKGFSYSVSHDMRAPLRAMQSFAQFLVDEYGSKLDEKGVNYLHQIMRSAVRLDSLIRDVLSYTRILHNPLPMGSVDLDRLVRDIVETFPSGQPIKPEIQIKGTLPKVMGNEALLAQCVSNLLSNGVKFVAPGTTPHVEILAEAIDNSSIRVWLKDNGIGIAPENHKRIFRLFERIHPAADYGGTGIGLTIVRKATERMGAQVGFESELGKGSKFWIQLKKA
jgi:signal transduction histidine kinase